MSSPTCHQKYLQYQKIISTGQKMGYLQATQTVREKGGLPSHVLHDDYLVDSSRCSSLPFDPLSTLFGLWARELIVYPAKGGQFKKGQDVVDTSFNSWVLPASCIPEQAVGRANVGLFIDPERIEADGGRVVVLAEPSSIITLDRFLQQTQISRSVSGKVDLLTRIPLEASEELSSLTENKIRSITLHDSPSGVIRPLAREYDLQGPVNRRTIRSAVNRNSSLYGVAYVELDGLQYDHELSFSDCVRLLRSNNISSKDMNLLLGMLVDNVRLFSTYACQISPNDVAFFLTSSNLSIEFRFDLALQIFGSIEDSRHIVEAGRLITDFAKKNPSALEAPQSVLNKYITLERRLSE